MVKIDVEACALRKTSGIAVLVRGLFEQLRLSTCSVIHLELYLANLQISLSLNDSILYNEWAFKRRHSWRYLYVYLFHLFLNFCSIRRRRLADDLVLAEIYLRANLIHVHRTHVAELFIDPFFCALLPEVLALHGRVIDSIRVRFGLIILLLHMDIHSNYGGGLFWTGLTVGDDAPDSDFDSSLLLPGRQFTVHRKVDTFDDGHLTLAVVFSSLA